MPCLEQFTDQGATDNMVQPTPGTRTPPRPGHPATHVKVASGGLNAHDIRDAMLDVSQLHYRGFGGKGRAVNRLRRMTQELYFLIDPEADTLETLLLSNIATAVSAGGLGILGSSGAPINALVELVHNSFEGYHRNQLERMATAAPEPRRDECNQLTPADEPKSRPEPAPRLLTGDTFCELRNLWRDNIHIDDFMGLVVPALQRGQSVHVEISRRRGYLVKGAKRILGATGEYIHGIFIDGRCAWPVGQQPNEHHRSYGEGLSSVTFNEGDSLDERLHDLSDQVAQLADMQRDPFAAVKEAWREDHIPFDEAQVTRALLKPSVRDAILRAINDQQVADHLAKGLASQEALG